MSGLVASPKVKAAARKAGLQIVEPSETATERQPELSPAPVTPESAAIEDDRREFRRRLLLLDLRLQCPAFAEPPRPLAPDIEAQIAAKFGAEPVVIAAVLSWWTGRVDYLQAVAAGRPRVDLAGRPVALPTAEERRAAAAKLAKLGGER